MRKVSKKVIVNQVENEEVPTEILAKSIVEISKGIQAIRKCRLKDKTIVMLISAASGVNKTDVSAVIEAMDGLESIYLKSDGTPK